MLLSNLLAASVIAAPLTEVRGTWLTTTANEAISSPRNTSATMKRLREIGLNTVYVEVWKNGYTEFPSKVAKRFTGKEIYVNPSPAGGIQRDLLQETMIEAHRNQMVYIAWFEYGFMAAHEGTDNTLRKRKDWLSLDKNGNEVAKNGFVWLNPLHPDSQKLLLGIVTEAIRKYDLDGIQLDDRIVWPYIDMGYDPYTRALYAKENGGAKIPDDPRDKQWMAWRQKKVEAFSKKFVAEVRKVGGKNFIISLSPGPHPWALQNYLIDWPAWSRWQGIPTWDEYVPQVYRMSYASFERDWKQQVGFMGNRNKDLLAGIRLTGDGPDSPRETIGKHAELPRQTRSGGHVWWYSKGVLENFPNEIAQFYDVKNTGQASHPRFGPNWRPAPTVGKSIGTNRWAANLEPGKYRAIANVDGAWKQLSQIKVNKRKQVSVTVAGATAVEFLVQRR